MAWHGITLACVSAEISIAQAVLSKIRDRFGGNLKVSFVGGAATSMEVLNFFENIDIKILEGYGLTETSPLVTVNTPEQVLHRRHRGEGYIFPSVAAVCSDSSILPLDIVA